jgi:DNA repair ATPase RecN
MRCMGRREENRLRKLGEAVKWLEKMEQRYAKQIKVVRKKRKELAAEHRKLVKDFESRLAEQQKQFQRLLRDCRKSAHKSS